MIYSEEDLPQKSEVWKEFRLDKIGTSEIPILTGKFPTIWCTDYELFLRKMGKPYEFSNEHIERGDKNEEIARNFVINYLNNKENEEFSQNVYDRTDGFNLKELNLEQYTVQYKDFPQIFTSYDGIDLKNSFVLEIKCPSEKSFTKLLKNRKPTVPKMYLDQIQGQLMVANSHWGINNGIFAIFYEEGVIFKNKKTKEERLIKLILIKTELDLKHCEEIKEICKKYCEMIENRRWKKNWKD